MSRTSIEPSCLGASLGIASPSPPLAKKSVTATANGPGAQVDSQVDGEQRSVSHSTCPLPSSVIRTTMAPAGAVFGAEDAPNLFQSIAYRRPDTRMGALPWRSTASSALRTSAAGSEITTWALSNGY